MKEEGNKNSRVRLSFPRVRWMYSLVKACLPFSDQRVATIISLKKHFTEINGNFFHKLPRRNFCELDDEFFLAVESGDN